MRLPLPCYPLLACVEAHLPHLRPAQQRSLALWVTGTLLGDRVIVADFSINAVRRLGIAEGGAMRIQIPTERLLVFPQVA